MSETSNQNAVAYRVLARKYRPKTFADLIGQEALVRTLTNAFATGRIAQAYMLTGVRGVGKTTTARLIARALNYPPGPTIDMAEITPQCEAILESRHMDVIEMDAASNTGVDNMREIIDSRALCARAGAHQGLHYRRSAHAVEKRFQRAVENAGRAAAPCEVHFRHNRNPQSSRHHSVTLPTL